MTSVPLHPGTGERLDDSSTIFIDPTYGTMTRKFQNLPLQHGTCLIFLGRSRSFPSFQAVPEVPCSGVITVLEGDFCSLGNSQMVQRKEY